MKINKFSWSEKKHFISAISTIFIILSASFINIPDVMGAPVINTFVANPTLADVGETILLKAVVTYGDEKVDDADELNFEYWEEGNEDDSTTIASTNNGDGTYTAEITIERDGVFSIYAHTTARALHTMPKKSVIVGKGDVE